MKKKLAFLIILVLAIAIATFAGCADIQATENKVSTVKLFTTPDKTVYVQGESLDLSGAQIQIAYEDNTYEVKDVTSEMVSAFNPTVLGVQLLRISYKGVGCTLQITVVKSEVESIEVVKSKDQNYIVEQNLDFSSVSLKVTYTNGLEENYSVSADMCSEYDMTMTGEQSVRVALKIDDAEYVVYYDISVRDKQLIGIEVANAPTKNIYYVGDTELDLTDGVLFLQFDNGYPEKVNMSDLSGLGTSWNSTQVTESGVVKLTYMGLTASFYVSIKVKDVLEIEEISTAAEIKAIAERQLLNTEIDLSGLSLKLTYNNYKTEIVTFPTPYVSIEGYDMSQIGEQEIVIKFLAGATIMETGYPMTIYVQDKIVSDIEIVKDTDVIYQDTQIDISDWEYILIYNNGERSEPEPLADNMIIRESHEDVYKYATAGTKTWIIKYRTFELPYEFEVTALNAVKVEVTSHQPATVYFGHDFDATGVYLRVTYNSGLVKENVPMTSRMVEDFDKELLGAQNITVNYYDSYTETCKTRLQVVVVKRVATSLGIYQEPVEVNYTISQTIDFTGLQIALTYEGESETTIVSVFDEDWSFENDEWDEDHQFATTGAKKIWITYAGLDDPASQGVMLTVNVRNAIMNFTIMGDLGSVVIGNELSYSEFIFTITYEEGFCNLVYDEDAGQYVMRLENKEIVPMKGTLTFDYKPRNMEIGERQVKVIYTEDGEEYECNTQVIVLDRSIVALEVYKAPNKLEYVANSGELLDPTGLVVNAVYDNGTRTVLSDTEYTTGEVDTILEDGTDDGVREIGVRLSANPNIGTSFFVYVKDSVAVAIAWTTDIPTVNMKEGVEFNIDTAKLAISGTQFANSEVKITLSNGSTIYRTISNIRDDLSVYTYEKYSVGTQTAEICYKKNENMLLKVDVVVEARTLTSIEFISDVNLEVIESAELDVSLSSLRLNYDYNMSTDTIPMNRSYINKSTANPGGYDKTDITAGLRTVDITYGGITISIDITVKSKSLQSISMNRMPKVKYIEGEFMDNEALEGGSIVLYYDNGATEEKFLVDASINMPQNSFNIDISRFDNTEFSGKSKLQTIFVTYTTENGDKYQTDFDIIMRDRKYLQVNYDSDNIYAFTYGELNEENAPKLSVKGYLSFDSTERLYNFDMDKIVVEYVRYEERNDVRDPHKDYTKVPTEAGRYVICVTYNSALYGDMVHNSLNDATKIITIYKKDIYIAVSDVNRVYGINNQKYIVKAYGVDTTGGMSSEVAPFAYEDSMTTVGFHCNAPTTGSLCYDEFGNEIRFYNITITSTGGTAIDMVERTPVGTYVLKVDGLTSDNYNIKYVEGVFTVEKRLVKVTPQNVTMTYGTLATEITYTTSAVEGVANSGLYTLDSYSDELSGTPIRVSGKDAGEYAITIGTLSNPNYEIVFDDTKIVTIVKRDIYVKVQNTSKIYGEDLPEFQVAYFKNEACTDSKAFAYEADLPIGLGTLGFIFEDDVDKFTPVGLYAVSAKITPYSAYSVPEGVVNINGNYEIHYISGYLEIDRRSVTVVAENKTKSFSDDDPALTYTVNKTDGSDGVGLAAIDLVLEQYETLAGSLSRITGEDVGRYVINIGDLVEANPNYEIHFTQATFTIEKMEITVVIAEENLNKVYDGKMPSITEYEMYKAYYTDTPVYYGNQDIQEDYVLISIISPTRNAGTYSVDLETYESNITVAFPEGAEYKYVIAPSVVDIVYDNIPTIGNNEYKKGAYTFSAHIPTEQLMIEYNSDGTIKTDDNNQVLKDSVQVVLNRNSVTEVGEYTIYPRTLSGSTNYVLSDEAKSEIVFSIVPRELVIEVYPTDTVNNILAKEYNGQGATLNIKEYTVHNTIPGDTLQVVPYVYNPNSTVGTAPRDVLYNDDGEIDAYEIRVNQPTSSNYNVSFKEQYYYMITPKDVTITIFSSFLSKTYDGNEPSINASNYSVSIATLMTSTISFEFVRELKDGRSNSDVGTYAIKVNCTDKNHNVKLSEEFVYTIERASVTVTVKANANTKSYDGSPISFKDTDISMSSTPGITPRIRTFANTTDYQDAKDVLANMSKAFAALNASAKAIEFTSLDYALILWETAKSDFTNAASLFKHNGSALFTAQNYNTLNNYITTLGGADGNSGLIGNIKTYIDGNDITSANNTLARVTTMVSQAYDVVNKENHYLAFIFIMGNDSTATAVGTYQYEMKYQDLNKDYNLQNATTIYTITKQNVVLKITGLNDNGPEATYGDITSPADVANWEQNKLGIAFYGDISFTNELQGINIQGTLDITGIENAGYAATEGGNGYVITPSESILGNSNYIVTYNPVYFEIAKKTVTIVGEKNTGTIDDTAGIIYYGDVIEQYKLRRWSLKNGGAELVGADTIDMFDTDGASFECELDLQPVVGKYEVVISGFVASNYNFEYESGWLTINKRPLYIKTDSAGYLNRTYGDNLEVEFENFAYDENMSTLGSFVAPGPADPNDPGFDLKQKASSNEYIVKLKINDEDVDQFDNYYIVLEDEYSLIISRAILQLVFTGKNGANYLEAVYGSAPEYTLAFAGFKNGETAESLGVDINKCVEFDLARTVAESGNLFSEDVHFTDDAEAKLSNYEYSVRDVRYYVRKKELTVKLNKDLSVFATFDSETGEASIDVGAYMLFFNENTYSYQVVSGQYKGSDIIIEGFVNDETAATVFKFLTINEENYEYYDDVVSHKLSFNPYISGPQELKLTDLEFVTPVPNYSITYLPSTITVYSKIKTLSTNEEYIILEGDSLDSITYAGITEISTTQTFSLTDDCTTYSGLDVNLFNTNQTISITYGASYNLTGYDGDGTRELTTIEAGEVVTKIVSVESQLTTTINNTNITNDVVLRILKKKTKTLDTTMTYNDEDYVNGSQQTASTATSESGGVVISSKELVNSDVIHLSIRADRNRNLPFSTTGTIKIMLEGVGSDIAEYAVAYDENGDLYLDGDGNPLLEDNLAKVAVSAYNIKLVCNMQDSENRYYYLAFCGVYKETDGQDINGNPTTIKYIDGSEEIISYRLDFGNINIFDGASHDIKFYHDKRLGTIYITLDGNLAPVITIGDNDNLKVFNNISKSQLSIEAIGDLDVSVTGVKRMIQGYQDNYATLVRPATTDGTNVNTLRYIKSSFFNYETIQVNTLFSQSALKDATYIKKYYMNGTLVATANANGSLKSGSFAYTCYLGTYRAEMVIVNGSDNIVSSDYIMLVFSASPATISINGKTFNPSKPSVIEQVRTNIDMSVVEAVGKLNFTDSNMLTYSDDNSIVGGATTISRSTSEGIVGYRSIELSIGYEPARVYENNVIDIRTQDTFNYIMLYGNSQTFETKTPYYPKASNYIALQIIRSRARVNEASYTTQLIVCIANKKYTTDIASDIDWGDGSIYTIGLYMDYLNSTFADPNGNAYIWGNKGFSIVISKGSQYVMQAFYNSTTQFNQGSIGAISLNNFLKTTSGYSPAIYNSDSRITVYDAIFNGDDAIRHNYYLRQDSGATYIASDVENGNEVDTNQSLTLASPHGRTSLYSAYNAISLKFQSATAVATGSGTFTWYIARKFDGIVNDNTGDSPYELYLIYDAKDKKLYFAFSYDGRNYVRQQISSGKNLTDGNIHTISVVFNRTPTILQGAVTGVIDPVNTSRIVASTLSISIDSGTAKTAYYPYYNTTNCWYYYTDSNNTNKNSISGDMVLSSGNNFMSLYNYTYFKAGNTTPFVIYNYDVGFMSAGGYASTEYGEALI